MTVVVSDTSVLCYLALSDDDGCFGAMQSARLASRAMPVLPDSALRAAATAAFRFRGMGMTGSATVHEPSSTRGLGKQGKTKWVMMPTTPQLRVSGAAVLRLASGYLRGEKIAYCMRSHDDEASVA